MKRFLGSAILWLDRTRRFTLNTLFLIVIITILTVIFSSNDGDNIPASAVLVINPEGQLTEEMRPSSSNLIPAIWDAGQAEQIHLHSVAATIRYAAHDERIQALLLKLNGLQPAALPKLQELRSAIELFKQQGKKVVAEGTNYSQSQYYLAATADQVFLHPMGAITISGFSIYHNYFKELLDNLQIHVQLFRAGNYKAAAEPLIRNTMSAADREASSHLLTQLWERYKQDIASMRNISAARIQQVLDHPSQYLQQHGGSLAELALAEGLVDQLATDAEVQHYLAALVGNKHDLPTTISLDRYQSAIEGEDQAEHEDKIGIIVASGMILDGDQPSGSIGSKSMQDMLEQASHDDSIRAVVIRVDSPGGAAQASELIRTAIVQLQQKGKPVVISMGSMAASGGYWLSAPANEIWASPATITGSIGVFGVLAHAETGLTTLGIHTDGVGTTSIAAGVRPDQALPVELAKVMQLSINATYHRFMQVVSTGRHIPAATVAKLAEGRVWSGDDAMRLGLVDHLGSFTEAVDAAAKLANLKAYDKQWLAPSMTLQEQLLLTVFGQHNTFASNLIYTITQQALAAIGITSSSRELRQSALIIQEGIINQSNHKSWALTGFNMNF